MVIKVYPRTVFEIVKGTLTEQKLLDSSSGLAHGFLLILITHFLK